MGQRVYKCLVVDDDLGAHATIEAHIIRTEGLQLVGHAFNGEEAISLLSSNLIDILFLDIEMPKFSGIELLQVLPYPLAAIITSAHTEYAFDAFQNYAIDYVQKPILYDRFLVAAAKAKTFAINNSTNSYPEFLELKTTRKKITIQQKDIVFIQSIGNYIKVFVQNQGTPIIAYSALRSIQQQLTPNEFIQVHRSFIVRKSVIEKKEKLDIHLKNGAIIPVGAKFDYLIEAFI